jgi:hypothetical protein
VREGGEQRLMGTMREKGELEEKRGTDREGG